MRLGLLVSTTLALAFGARGAQLRVLNTSALGKDPATVNHLNGESFQQDALVTSNGYQYAAFWTPSSTNASVRHAVLSRRALSGEESGKEWETLTLTDYNQTEDDGHDIISIGISPGDGTLHMIFDQHDNALHYRSSNLNTTFSPSTTTWSASLFGPILDHLPGPASSLSKDPHFINVTYPRFVPVPANAKQDGDVDLVLEFRVGRSGLGDDWLYEYTPNVGWSLIGKYLAGVNNNPYINGLHFSPVDGTLHTTWTYRDYINDTGKDVAVQAGPNGPENNHDLVYAYSADLGRTWHNNWGQAVADVSKSESILPTSAGVTVFSIPKYGGILNQEGQTVDAEGRVHVLNRENTTGIEQWYHYWRSKTHNWTRTPLPLPAALEHATNVTGTPTVIGKRGKLVSHSGSGGVVLFALLPSNAPNSTALTILSSTAVGHFRDWTVAYDIEQGCAWEPHFDQSRLSEGGDGVLSLFLTNAGEVRVVDLDLNGA